MKGALRESRNVAVSMPIPFRILLPEALAPDSPPQRLMQKPDLSTSPRAIWSLTWPQLVMMYVMTVMTLIPVWTAGRLGAGVQAALGMANQCSLFLSVVCLAVASGATAAVSQSLGAMRVRRANFYITTTLSLSFVLGIVTGIVGYLLSTDILGLLGISEDIRPMADEIWRVFMLGLPMQYLYMATGVVFRATRRVVPPLVVASLVTVVHAFVCFGASFGWFGMPELGYCGIAWATVAAQVFGCALNMALLCRDGYLCKRHVPTLRWLGKALPYLLRVAIPAGISSLVWQSGYLVLFILVATVPFQSVKALAGLTAGLRIEGFIFMPAMAFNMSASVLVGNCLGAGDETEARRVAFSLLRTAVLLMSVMAVFIWPFRQEIAEAFSTDAATQGHIVTYLFYNLLSTPFSICSTVLGGVMVGSGATHYNLMVFGGSFWGLRLPLGYFLGHHAWGNAEGIFFAMLLSQVLQALFMLVLFFRGGWTKCAMRAGINAHAKKGTL